LRRRLRGRGYGQKSAQNGRKEEDTEIYLHGLQEIEHVQASGSQLSDRKKRTHRRTGKKTGNFSIATRNSRIFRQIRKISKNNSGLTAE
jgi:hypothetical protein